jgi:hypothetical protein
VSFIRVSSFFSRGAYDHRPGSPPLKQFHDICNAVDRLQMDLPQAKGVLLERPYHELSAVNAFALNISSLA